MKEHLCMFVYYTRGSKYKYIISINSHKCQQIIRSVCPFLSSTNSISRGVSLSLHKELSCAFYSSTTFYSLDAQYTDLTSIILMDITIFLLSQTTLQWISSYISQFLWIQAYLEDEVPVTELLDILQIWQLQISLPKGCINLCSRSARVGARAVCIRIHAHHHLATQWNGPFLVLRRTAFQGLLWALMLLIA